jgi:hypothetical protein
MTVLDSAWQSGKAVYNKRLQKKNGVIEGNRVAGNLFAVGRIVFYRPPDRRCNVIGLMCVHNDVSQTLEIERHIAWGAAPLQESESVQRGL